MSNDTTNAAYLAITPSEWEHRIDEAYALMRECRLCPRECQAERLEGGAGACGATGGAALLSSYGPHFGEEAPLVGHHGSGTIFMTRCNLKCVFCQNYDISHLGEGMAVTASQLTQIMLRLQQRGCHNVNFVTPTHFVPQILEALRIAADSGLHVPLVYNCGGYESVETLELLDGIVDIYMPDFKYADAEVGRRFSGVPDYPEVAKTALKEMHRQVGDLRMDAQGIAQRGLLVRHLVLPEGLAGTAEAMRFLVEEISPDTYVNLMAQYHPAYQAHQHPELRRPLPRHEYREAIQMARDAGLTRLDRG